MKKKFTIIGLVLLICSGSFAQTPPKFRFGIGGNTGFAWLKPTSKGLSRDGMAAAYGYGLMFDWNLSDNYAISTGLDVNYRGGGLKYSADSINGSTTVTMQYIEIPIQLKMKTKPIGYFTYFTSFGGSLGYTLSRTGNYSLKDDKSASKTLPAISVTDDKLNSYFNPISISLLINLGTEYNISGKTSIYGSLFFNNSFLDVATDPKLNGKSYEMTSRANVFGLKLGIFF